MPDCSFCNRPNPAHAPRCLNCGAELPEAAARGMFDPESSPSETGGVNEEDLEVRVVELLQQGQKIQAIKVYRSVTRVGLAEAKHAVEAIAHKHAVALPQTTGCAGMLLALALPATLLTLVRNYMLSL